MPEFFSFTQGAETNPRLRGAETTPLLVGRFRAVVPPSEAALVQPPLLPAVGPVPKRPRQRPPYLASRSYWNAPASLLPSRSPSPFSAAGGGRIGIGRRNTTGFESLDSSRGGHLGPVIGHGFYNNTGYGAIAEAGYYDGIGDDEEDEEEEEEVEHYDDGYDEDDEDEYDDSEEDNEGNDFGDDDNDYDYEPDYVDEDIIGGPSHGPRDLVGTETSQTSKREESRRSRWSAWSWPSWARQRRGSAAALDAATASQNSRRRRSSALAPSAAQRYRLNQRVRRQQHRQRQRQQQHRRLRRKIRRTYRVYRYCGRRAGRWIRRSIYRTGRHLRNLWLTPKNATVRRAVDRWWSRWTLLVILPAMLAVAWCALPFPQYPLDEASLHMRLAGDDEKKHHRTPGHGEARVRIHFWFFLFAYYGPYNVTALVWITKVFNLYSLNWWPPSLGFPLSVSLLAAFSLAVPAVLFCTVPAVEFLASHNTAWVTWTFAIMAMPVAAALLLLLVHERHRTRRHTVSDTQRIFTSARWAGEPDTLPRRWRERQRKQQQQQLQKQNSESSRFRVPMFGRARAESVPTTPAAINENGPLTLSFDQPQQDLETASLLGNRSAAGLPVLPPLADDALLGASGPAASSSLGRGGNWLPASFVRFLWLMSALFTSLLVYELGEASASLFLAALPTMQHATVYTVAYVYGWIVTVFLLDFLTGWILGGRQGERVGSYPLGWVFKLYFMLTYQTYVRALYVRLRSPSQFVLLQVLSSTTLIVISPLLMCSWTHRLLVALGLNAQTYGAFQKVCVRNIFVRFVAENASMLAFLGSLLVLHFGPNRDVYPYFAFDDGLDGGPGYTFSFTLYASSITWACELGAAFIVSGLIRYFYGLSVVGEGKMDLAVWPELLPTSVAVSVHVLQNMLFSIIRLQFW
ncbi:hypothetical protein SBRCBS47491_010008 [Sporothrix bragantina]|uniref:Uncharacterized protein n=1 Tax=Sporothrix bragantina TaxID=671064 RepID=A0ABP0D2N8_9PEZI